MGEVYRATDIQPDLSLALIRRGLGAMSPDVDHRMAAAVGQAGLE